MKTIDFNFENILGNILRQSELIKSRFETPEYDQSVDIDHFIDVLYSLMKSGGFTLSKDELESSVTDNKFLFTEDYPDLVTPDVDIVTVDINRREPASLESGKEPFNGRKQYRPYLVSTNKTEDGHILQMANLFDNRIEITCWSEKTSRARKLALLIESLMHKYYWAFKEEGFPLVIYEGRGKKVIDDNDGDKRKFGIPLTYFVRTVELFTLEENELKNIEIISTIGA